MTVSFVFIGGVDVSEACLRALCEAGQVPALAVGYDESFSKATGFADFGPLASRFGFELLRVGDVNDPGLLSRIEDLRPAVVYVIGWSQIVRSELLGVPRHGCVGIHPTKLPEGRGRAPIPWTILKRLERTGCSMFFLAEGVDDGDLIGQIEFELDPREDAGTLYAKHRAAHVELVRRFGAALLEGTVEGTPQDHKLATIWPRRDPEDGRIDWTDDADAIDRLVRAVTRPFPGAFAETPEGKITIWRAEPGPPLSEPPGSRVDRDGTILVACGTGSLRLLEVGGPA